MKALSIREARRTLTKLETLLATEGEVTITKRGRPVARLVAVAPKRPVPSHLDLRESMPVQRVPSEILIRRDRDGRG